MNKKVQIVIWAIILIIAFLLLGGYVYMTAMRVNEGNTHPEVTFEIGDYGTVKMELYPEYAPNTVTNFIKLVEKGYYNNKVIYGKDEICLYLGRTSEGKVENPKLSLISENVDPAEDYEYTIPGEFIANGFEKNTLRHEKGIVSLIRNDYTQYVSSLSKESYDSGNAQLGIMMTEEASNLNGTYAAFGKITEGIDVLEKVYNESEMAPVENAEGENGEKAEEAIKAFKTYPVITSASVDTHGIDYGNPIVEKAFDYSSYLYNLMSSYYGNNQ